VFRLDESEQPAVGRGVAMSSSNAVVTSFAERSHASMSLRAT
jgi:hypothetical protein